MGRGATSGLAVDAAPESGQRPASPPATLLPRRRWRDWRLVSGVVLVLGSVVLGAQVVSAADDTVEVWAARADLPAGSALTADALTTVPVLLEAPSNPYLTGTIPDGYVVVRPVGAGELLPASAVVPADEADRVARLVAVSLSPDAMPGPLDPGDRVDVWILPDSLDDSGGPAQLLVSRVPVSSVPSSDSAFGASSGKQSVVLSLDGEGLDPAEFTQLTARLVAASAADRAAITLDPAPR